MTIEIPAKNYPAGKDQKGVHYDGFIEDETLIKQGLRGENGKYQRVIVLAGYKMIALLLRKNSDYGASVFQNPVLSADTSPEQGILVRMSDKVARLVSLTTPGKDQQVKTESVEDTLNDLTGYNILRIAARMVSLLK